MTGEQSYLVRDEDTFRRIYDKYAPSLRYFAAKYLDNSEPVDDIVQEALILLWENRKNFFVENAVKAYLYRVVQTNCLNIIRHQKVKGRYAEFSKQKEDYEIFLDNVLETEIFQVLLMVFDELPPACKEAYRLSLDGLRHEEIADKLNITVNTVKKHKNNANHYMRARMKHILELMLLLKI